MLHVRTLLLAMLVASPATASASDAFFESKVRPLLVQHCYACHSAESGKSKGGLLLDTRSGWATGGDSGPALVPGKPDDSLVIRAIRYHDEGMRMPPKGKLAAAEIEAIEAWVKMGAPDPRVGEMAKEKKGIDLAAGRQFWSFRPLAKPTVPAVKDAAWPRGDVDRFLLATMESKGGRPVRDAEPAALLRRLTYDLTGLPPTEVEVSQFQKAWASDPQHAIEEAADRLLATRHFGEKWARHWLDIARYADSNGSSFNPPFREAWKYRNWVIDAHNADLPYDQFLIRQIAGDLLPAANPAERDANIIATGFLMFGSKVLGQFDKPTLFLDVVDEQLDSLGKGLLGLTLGCARCHDHKFDPVPQRDYYAMAGILSSTRTLTGRIGGPLEDENDWSRRGLGDGGEARLKAFTEQDEYARVKAGSKHYVALRKAEKLRAEIAAGTGDLAKAKADLAKAEADAAEWGPKSAALEAKLPPLALAPRDVESPADEKLRIRGVAASLGDVIPRGFLQVVAYADQPRVNTKQSGRLELAHWIAHPDHPLTARVHVNRVWAHLFGEGLVRTQDNFGLRGESPSHPELLDHLARRFIEQGWRMKPLVRELVTSRAYRLAAFADAENAARDPENRLHWRYERRRLSPEELRDTLLDLAGKLDRTAGTTLIDHLPMKDLNEADMPHLATLRDSRRTIYQPIIRNMLTDALEVFDFANPSMTVSRRPRTTVAPQALYLMNSPFVSESAKSMANRLLATATSREPEKIVDAAVRLSLRRPPTVPESEVLTKYLQAQYEGPGTMTAHDVAKLCHAIVASTLFQYLD